MKTDPSGSNAADTMDEMWINKPRIDCFSGQNLTGLLNKLVGVSNDFRVCPVTCLQTAVVENHSLGNFMLHFWVPPKII